MLGAGGAAEGGPARPQPPSGIALNDSEQEPHRWEPAATRRNDPTSLISPSPRPKGP